MSQSTVNRSLRISGIWCAHVLLLAAGVVWASSRWQALSESQELPPLRTNPLHVGPLYDRPKVVSDEQLTATLQKLQPRLRHKKPKINYVDHALRFWGAEAVFEDPDALSGVELRELLVDHRRFRSAWGESERPFLIDAPVGVRFRTQEGRATASHYDHTLACLAEVGTPLDYPLQTPTGETDLRSVLLQSLHDFSLNQTEYEWSALAYALYLPPSNHFYTTEGQKVTFDMLAERIMRQRLEQGVCRGNHRLHALVVLLRVDEQHPILTPAARDEVVAYLQDVTKRFVANQQADGYWDNDWAGSEWDGPGAPSSSTLTPLTARILVTGHVMEWWALSPPEILPPDEVLVKAGQWLCKTIDGLPKNQVVANYTFLSHAGHALALWRHLSPADCCTTIPQQVSRD